MRLPGITDQALHRISRKVGDFLAEPPYSVGEKYKGVTTHPGFHTTGDLKIAAQYAVGRVAQSYTDSDENDVHYVTDYPVVVALDMSGHEPQTDYDAEEMVWEVLELHLQEMAGWHDLTVDSSDEEIRDAAFDILESDTEPDASSTDPLSMIAEGTFYHFGNPLSGLVEESGFPDAFRKYMQTGDFSSELLMLATDQYRYTEDVGADRVRAVWFITPVATEMEDYDNAEGELESRWPGFNIPWIDDVYGGYFDFEEQLVWGEPESDQTSLFSETQYQPRSIEYHGTTLKRLLEAAPHLQGELPEPPSPPYRESGDSGGRVVAMMRRIAQRTYTMDEVHEFQRQTSRNLLRLRDQVRSVSSFEEHRAAAEALLTEWDRELTFEEDAGASGHYEFGSSWNEVEFAASSELYDLTRELGQDFADRTWGEAHDDPSYREVMGYLSSFGGGDWGRDL